MSRSNPRVSVVIPNYNYAEYLLARFQSILDQSFRDYEIIFLDDASTDGSVEMAQNLFASHIDRFEVNSVNSGNPFCQWNRGARLARGEYLWIAEADDLCAPGFLETMVTALDASPRLGLAYCVTTPIDRQGTVLDHDFHRRYLADLDTSRWCRDFTASGADEVKRYLGRKNTITNVSGVLFRRQAYLDAGLAPEHLRMCGDWLTYCRVLAHSDVAFVARELNFHRQHPAKHTLNSVLDLTYFREFLEVQQDVAQRFDLAPPDRRDAFRRFMGEWDRLTVSGYGRLKLGATVATARMAARYYSLPGEQVRILAHLAKNISTSLVCKWSRP